MSGNRHREAGRGWQVIGTHDRRLLRWPTAIAGPLVIIAGVMIILGRIAFFGKISSHFSDLLTFGFPSFCFLGKSLAAGHIPAWNPHVMAGVPFAADPQSGWMNGSAMLLFATLSCSRAIRFYIVLQPILGGLGMYAFLRGEGLSRPSSTVGGLVIALPLASAYDVLNLPFSATIGWTAVTLAFASGYARADHWPSRLAWLGGTAFAWGQVVAALMSDGLVLSTAILVLYLGARGIADVRAGRRKWFEPVIGAAVLLVALPLVNLAFLLPRLAYLPRTTLGAGYSTLDAISQRLTGAGSFALGAGYGPTWPLRFALAPGLHLGAAALLLAFGGWGAKGKRYLAISFGLFGVTCYVLMLEATSTSLGRHVVPQILKDFYLHDPSRFRFGLLIAIPVLAGLGLEAWMGPRTLFERAAMLAPGIAIWGILPPLWGAGPANLRLLWLGALLVGVPLLLSIRRSRVLALVPLVLAVEVCVNGLAGQAANPPLIPAALQAGARLRLLDPLRPPDLRAASLTQPGPIAEALKAQDDGRYVSINPSMWASMGYHIPLTPDWWGFMHMQQSMVFGLEEAQGYNPAQLITYWKFERATDPKVALYNTADFLHPSAVSLDMLQVAWIVGPSDRSPEAGAALVVQQGRWGLFQRANAPPRVSLVPSWTVVADSSQALGAVTSPGFSPEQDVILERGQVLRLDPALVAGPAPGSAAVAAGAIYHADGPQSASISVDAPASGLVLIRNAYEPGWHAEVDGKQAPVLRADSLIQAVPVRPGRHRIVLSYDDPAVGWGLAGSAVTVGALLVAALAARRRRRIPAQEPPATSRASKSDPAAPVSVTGDLAPH